jgi:hypothetical protein
VIPKTKACGIPLFERPLRRLPLTLLRSSMSESSTASSPVGPSRSYTRMLPSRTNDRECMWRHPTRWSQSVTLHFLSCCSTRFGGKKYGRSATNWVIEQSRFSKSLVTRSGERRARCFVNSSRLRHKPNLSLDLDLSSRLADIPSGSSPPARIFAFQRRISTSCGRVEP